MKSKLLQLICLLFLSQCFATDYYISNDGLDTNNGTSAATPWKTFTNLNAKFAINGIYSPDRIFFRRGDTFRGSIAYQTWQDGIVFDSYGTGALPIIKGSQIVTGWTLHSGSIWKATVTNKVYFFYSNSQAQTLARTPNTGTFTLTSNTSNSITSTAIGSSGQNFIGANLCLRQYDWQLARKPITSQSSNVVSWANGITISNPGANFYFDNKLSLLDADNEWYYDDSSSTLYFQSSVNPNTLLIEASTKLNGIDASDNRSGNVIKNLQFEHYAESAINLPGTTINNLITANVFKNNYTGVALGGKFTATLAEANLIDNNTFDNNYGESIFMLNTANSTISNNTALNTGLAFGKHRPDFQGEFYSTGIKVINARIGTIISGNTITNCGNNGIRFNGPGVTVEKNKLENILLNMSDGGAIYTVGTESINGIIKQNFVKNVPGDHNGVPGGIALGIYLDNHVSNFLIEENTVENVDGGILINAQAHDNTIKDNVAYKVSNGVGFADWVNGASVYNNTMTGNTLYTNVVGGAPVLVQSDDNNYNVFTASNNNFLVNPYGTTVVERKWSAPATYTLAQWRTLSGFDNASVGSFYTWSFPVDRSFIVKNQTSSTLVLNYINTVDLNNNAVTTLNLPAYSSKVLISVGDPCVTDTWTGTTDNLWNTATNWSCGSVPDGTKDILISQGSPELATALTMQAGKTLTLNGTASLIIAPTGSITINGSVDFGGKQVVLKSDATGTASIGQVTGTLSGATNVVVERFIPAKRAWRLLTAPLKGTVNNSIATNWQGVNGEGLLLFSPAALGYMGYTAGGTSPNIKKYNSGWENITNLGAENMFGTTPSNTKSYLVFPTGPYGSTNIASGATATTLRPKGQLITGAVNHSGLAVDTYHLLPNPYASPIDPVSLISNNTGQKLWLLDPSLNSFGGYVTFDGLNWSLPTPQGNDALIQSGQGFFVRSESVTSFTISESNKVSGFSNNWFARNATATNSDKIRILLDKQIDNVWTLVDGILAVNTEDGLNEVDATDTNKISNFNESIMFRNGNTNLAIEYRALPIAGEVQEMRLTSTTATGYQLRVFTENYSNSTLQPYLQDTQAGTLTAIPLDNTEITIPFTGVASTSTNPDNRFRIVYQTILNIAPQSLLGVKVFPNPVSKNELNIHLGSANTANYTITNLLGQSIQGGILNNAQNTISISAVAKGIYILNVVQGDAVFATKINIQ